MRASVYRSVQVLSCCPKARTQAGSLAAALGKVIKEGLAKPALRVDGLAALLSAAYVGAANSQARTELEREKVWLQPGR